MPQDLGSPKMLPHNHSVSGSVKWRSPSNIALVKYWGKQYFQIPENPSISFTLSEAHTDTMVTYEPRAQNDKWVSFLFEGKSQLNFEKRIVKYLSSIKEILPWVDQLSLVIESSNSFPHSSGIASSASSMSALAMCLCDIEHILFKSQINEDQTRQKASNLSRIGSGSASRSVFPKIAAWGYSDLIPGSSNKYAVPVTDIADIFFTYHDDVLIVSDSEKTVSSSAGHDLMKTNVFAQNRYLQARNHLALLLNAMKKGDISEFGKIVEDEALTLHALMMCSDPSYILMKPATLEVLDRIRTYRKKTSMPIFFTLDAGPNIHILYPDLIAKDAQDFIQTELLQFAHRGRIIRDFVGAGPIKLK